MSPEDLCNEALHAVGWSRAIGDLYEGSVQSRTCLEIYAQTRNEVLTTDVANSFARGLAQLTLLKGPPPDGGYSIITPWSSAYPPPGFLYEYAYPSDAVELRAIISPTTALPEFDPQPATWRIDNDPSPVPNGTAAMVILTNVVSAMAVYRRRVTNLDLWRPPAIAAFISRLAAKLASSPRLAASQQMMQTAPAEAVYTAQAARGHRG